MEDKTSQLMQDVLARKRIMPAANIGPETPAQMPIPEGAVVEGTYKRVPPTASMPHGKEKSQNDKIMDVVEKYNLYPTFLFCIAGGPLIFVKFAVDLLFAGAADTMILTCPALFAFWQIVMWIDAWSHNKYMADEEPTTPEQKPEEEESPEQKRDRLLNESWSAIWTIKEINDRIPDQHFSEQVDAIELLSRQILEQASANEEKLALAQQFLTSYLPMTKQLLETYDRVYSMAVPGPNVERTKKKIEAALDTVILAFRQQADQLCVVDLAEASTDISTLLTSMACQGLGMENPWENQSK